MPNPYVDYDVAGTEISSTYEGRHITFPESYFNHPTHTDGLVDGKDPVTFGTVGDGYGVGVAYSSASGVNDLIAVDTEGIWAMSVVASDDEGNSAIEIGDVIYINRTTCVLSKISSDTTNIVFGYALDSATGDGAAHVIAVKVHWDPTGQRFDVYRDYLAAGAAENAMLIEVDDATTLATGYSQALQTTINATGDKTGDAEVHNVAADMAISGDTPYAYNYTAYVSTSGNPTIGQIAGVSVYLDDPGTACGNITAIDVGLAGGANSPAGRHCFMRMRNHSAGSIPDAAFQFEGTGNADYFCSWETVSVPIVAAAVGGAQTHKITVRVAGVDYFIPLNTA
uniref:Uncharacterized protein n=1 Tax=viral metagenome TaxID=1070528 RepID=A0A6M3MBZ2_9ZZZZ